jgi:methyltransferase (TIGR00027 family)
MSLLHGKITHVSDTALMAAAGRALESEAPDGFVRDPFAARLAGDRGMAILQALPYPGLLCFGVGLRSRFVDELLLEALASQPITTVLSVGCGLDTRPWRLELPSGLRWIEADFADMLDYKDALMSAEPPPMPARTHHSGRERRSPTACHLRGRGTGAGAHDYGSLVDVSAGWDGGGTGR